MSLSVSDNKVLTVVSHVNSKFYFVNLMILQRWHGITGPQKRLTPADRSLVQKKIVDLVLIQINQHNKVIFLFVKSKLVVYGTDLMFYKSLTDDPPLSSGSTRIHLWYFTHPVYPEGLSWALVSNASSSAVDNHI